LIHKQADNFFSKNFIFRNLQCCIKQAAAHMSETLITKMEFEFPAQIAWQNEIKDTLGVEFCRKLQIQIENLVAKRYNEGVDHFNRVLRDTYDAHSRALSVLNEAKKVSS
jgi:hypothetical protein